MKLTLRKGYDDLLEVRNDFYGLCPIDNVDPELLFRSAANYFHAMIDWATSLGYIPGETLFGFPYDWRQSIRFTPTFDRLEKLILKSSSNNKVDLITHSMGSLLVKALLGERAHLIKHIRNWIPIGTPWNGGAGVALKALINGYNLDIPEIPGWGGLSDKVANQLELGWPSVFELLPDLDSPAWEENPFISYNKSGLVYRVASEQEVLTTLVNINANNIFERKTPKENYPQPLDMNLWNHAKTTRNLLHGYENTISKHSMQGLNIFNIVGNGSKTKYGILFNQSVESLPELKTLKPNFFEAQGDGTVPLKSALAHGLPIKTYYYSGRNNHVKLLETEEILKAARHFLGLSCKIEGPWNITVTGVPDIPNNFIMNLTHKHTVVYPREQLLDKEEIAFIQHLNTTGTAILSKSCLSFTGDFGNGTWQGKRIIGSECRPLEKRATRISNGLNVVPCIYGVWSQGSYIECDTGYYLSNGACIKGSSQPAIAIVIGIIAGGIVVGFLILGLIVILARKRKKEVQYIH